MANFTSQLLVKLIDGVSGPARKAASALLGIGQANSVLNARINRMTRNLDAARGRMVDASAQAYALYRALGSPVKAAMEFESAMADVRKVVDFPTPEAFERFQRAVRDMSKRVPMAASDLTKLVAAAGQAGIAQKDLLRFAEMAAKVGVAFDISADQTGDALAKMMTGLGLSVEQVGTLADAMNHLSNAQASSAADILDVVRRVGAQSKQFGYNAVQVSAFASAMLSAGAESDVAATSFRNMGKALTKGASATKAQRRAYKALGLDAHKVSKAMQKDAVATTVDVLERISKLPKETQAAISSDLFGDEARALGPLLTNLDLLKRSLGLVARESDYAGSASKEYEQRAKTFANNVQLFKNKFEDLKISIGNGLIPAINDLMDTIGPAVERMSKFAEDHPTIVANVAKITAAVVGLRLAIAGLRWLGVGAALSFLQTARLVSSGTAAGAAWGKAFSVAARAAMIVGVAAAAFEALGAIDPKGNLGGLTKGIDDRIRKSLGLPAKDSGITPGEIWQGLTGGGKADPAAEQAKEMAAKKRAELDALIKEWPAAARRGVMSYGNALAQGGAEAEAQAASIGQRVEEALTVEGKPTVNTADLERALTLAREVAAAVRDASAAAAPKATPPQPLAGRRAKGGPVSAGRPYLVGEEGPEIITPSRSGYVHANGSGGGGSLNQTVNINITGSRDDDEIIAKVKRAISDATREALRGVQADYGFKFT